MDQPKSSYQQPGHPYNIFTSYVLPVSQSVTIEVNLTTLRWVASHVSSCERHVLKVSYSHETDVYIIIKLLLNFSKLYGHSDRISGCVSTRIRSKKLQGDIFDLMKN